MTTRESAAIARRAAVAAPADRPSQRRSTAEPGRATVRAMLLDPVIRESDDATRLEFTGYASITERAYEMHDMFGPYDEEVAADAFDETLARAGLDVPLVLDHDSLRRIARTLNESLRLSVDAMGLRVEADLDPSDVDVAYIVPKMRSGLIDEMSFRFRIDAGSWNEDYTKFRIERVDIHRGDVAIVGYGANPFTAGSGIRSAPAPRSGLEFVRESDLLTPASFL